MLNLRTACRAVLALAVVAGPGCGGPSERLIASDDQDVVVIFEEVAGRCTKTAGPGRPFVRPGEKVTWHFENYCGDLRNVSIVMNAGTLPDPFDDITVGRTIPRLRGKNIGGKPGKGNIQVRTKNTAPPDTDGPTSYQYTIRSSAGDLDPEIIIDW